MIRRTFITGRPKRRHSTPARSEGSSSGSRASFADLDNPRVPFSGDVNLLPLRQVLDGRIKRRIRRNGLSEEMNTITSEKRRRARETKAELERLKASVAEKDEEIYRLHNETVVVDTERVWELEKEVEALKKELANRSDVQEVSSPRYDWTMAARDPFSDDFMELDTANDNHVDDDDFGEATMADLACSTPTRKARTSFPTPPTTSPAAAPATPCRHLMTPRSDTGVQASLPYPEKEQLEDELASLQLEVCKLTSTLESYSALTSRLSDKLSPFASDPPADATAAEEPSSPPQPAIETHLNNLLRTLSDRTAALLHLNSSLSDLGFPGSDASEIITSLSSAFRTARLELEYLTPGEIPLPLTAAGASVLDLVLARLRDLARRAREADDSIDEYHAQERSLRQQLGARVAAMDDMAAQLGRRDARIADLEVGVDRLKGAARSYARDVAELEQLVGRMEGDLAAKDAERAAAVEDLERRLAGAAERTEALRAEVEALRGRHAEALGEAGEAHRAEVARLNGAHGRALAARDARVAELRGEVERLDGALGAAHEAVRLLRLEGSRLRAENEGLGAAVEEGEGRARGAIESMRAELERVVRMSEGLLATPKKVNGSGRKVSVVESGSERRDSALGEEGRGEGEKDEEVSMLSIPTSAVAGGLAACVMETNGRKKRRYDSGLGFLDEEEVDANA